MKKILAVTLCFVLYFSPLMIAAGEVGADTPKDMSNSKEYDLIVVGGEPEGIAAAVSAARNGLNTLLIEEGGALGGLMTLGGLNFLDMNYGPDKELLTRGIFAEFYEEMGNAFDLTEAKQYFLELVQKEEKIDLKLETAFLAPLMNGKTIIGIKVKEKGEIKEYKASRVIDATVDADVAAAAGVPYTIGAEDYGRKDELMGVTLIFRVKDVNWPLVFLYNNFMRLLSKLKSGWGDPQAGATWQVAWGYGEQALKYQPQDPQMRFRGPNLARQKDGTVLVNALLIFGVNSLDPTSKEQAIKRGKAEIPHLLEFMRENFVGFGRVQFVDTAERLYVRETRHIQGEYRLTITDVLENRDHWDRIAHGSYPVDIQPTSPENLGNVIGKPDIYSIPFRCLVPLEVENMLVVGRSASYDSLPHGSTRVIPVGMATGEAAGVAAAYSLEKGISFRELSRDKEGIKAVQERLVAQGAFLQEYTPPRPAVMDHWAYPGLRVMRELGLAAGGYGNDYQLDKPINYWDANYIFTQVSAGKKTYSFPENITRGHLLVSVVQSITGREVTPQAAYTYLLENGYLSEEAGAHFAEFHGKPTFGELYTLGTVLYQANTNLSGPTKLRG